MPRIRQYEAPEGLGLRPSDTGVSAVANSGRNIAAQYNEIAAAKEATGKSVSGAVSDAGEVAVKYFEHREVSQGAAEFANLQAGVAQRWSDMAKSADPNDPSVAAKFNEQVLEPALEKFSGAFSTEGGQRFAQQKLQSLREHMFLKTSADMSTLAGIAARKNLQTSANSMSNTAFNDPSMVPALIKDTDHSISAMVDSSPAMNAIDRARVTSEVSETTKQAIVRAGAIGAIQKASNPEAVAADWIQRYPSYINGENSDRLMNEARQQIRASRADDAYQHTVAKQAQQDASDKRESEYFAKLHSDDPQERASVNARDVANDPHLLREARERFVTIIERQNKPETDAKISAQNTVSVFQWMRQTNADAQTMRNRVDDEYAAGKVSWADRERLMKEVEDRKTPAGQALAQDRAAFFKQYAGAIAGPAYNPQMGDPKLYTAEMAARRTEDDLRKKGLDPHLAYDPTSEYFVGREGRLQKLQGDMQMDLGDRAQGKVDKTSPDVRPAALRGVASLTYSKSRNLYRDDMTGKLYRPDGTELKP